MSEEHRFIVNNTVVTVEEPYENDNGCVVLGKKTKDDNICVFLKNYSPNMVEFFIELHEYITDLEAKLAESEEQLNNSEQKCIICTKNQENEQLKQQLADAEEHIDNLELQLREQYQLVDEKVEQLVEKEKEIETLKKCGDTDHFYGLLEDKKNEFNWLHNKFAKFVEQANQDKISFTVEQLESLKETIAEKDKEMFSGHPIGIELRKLFMAFNTRIIDQQIKAIKEKRNESVCD